MTTAEVGVLLPVRIETRFRDGGLWLRVVPDFHIATHDVIMERGGGAMTAPLELPLAWEVPPS